MRYRVGLASGRKALLWTIRRRSTIELRLLCGDLCCGLSLRSGLRNLVGLVNGSFHYLFFFGVEIFGDILVEGRLLLLEAYSGLAYIDLAPT